MKKRGISQSAIAVYRECPYAYYLKYAFKKEPMFWDPTVLEVGGFVHDAIDKYYKLHFLMTNNPEEILSESYNELKKIWDISFTPEQLKKAYVCLQNHAEFEAENNGIKPLTEVKIDAGGFFGIIDYIDVQNNKLIDWKTGKYAYLSYDYRMQAHIYKTLFESKFGQTIDHFYFFFLHSNEWRTVKFDSEKQLTVGKEAEKFKNDILDSWDNNDFPKKPRLNCKNCDYKYYCRVEKK